MKTEIPSRVELVCSICGRKPRDDEYWGATWCGECLENSRRASRHAYWSGLQKELGAGMIRAPKEYADKSLANWQGGIPPGILGWLEPENDSAFLFIYGEVGTGKSHLATGCAVRWVMANIPDTHPPRPRWFDTQQLVDLLKPGGNEDAEAVEDVARNAPLIVLDDILVERQTDFAMDRVRMVVRHRHMELLPTIITANVGPKAIKKIDERLGSRLGSGIRVPIKGRDWRE